MRRVRWSVVLLLAAAGVTYATMPPATQHLVQDAELRTPVRGVVHVHTRRSDGTGDIDDVARAAANAGLKFVIVTDHGDGSREPDAPHYRHGVLCIDAVEVSAFDGHVVALGLPRVAYRLGGEARDVVEDIARLGGMSIAAHPSSPRTQLRWSDWDIPVDGLEWANADSEWRDEPVHRLARALLTYPFRRAETLATLLDRPDETLRQWDRLSVRRRVVAVAGSDAHAGLGFSRGGDPHEKGPSLPIPAYQYIFRTFSIALPLVTLTGDARADAGAIVEAIRHGQVYSSVDALAGPVTLTFAASRSGMQVPMGGEIEMNGPVLFEATSSAPPAAVVSLWRDGQIVKSVTGRRLEHMTAEAGAYRIEIQLPDAPGTPPVPWVLSNSIYVVKGGRTKVVASAAPRVVDSRYKDGPATGWRVEKSARSQGALDVVSAVGGTQISFRYALGGTQAESPFVALAMPTAEGLADYGRILFSGRANRPTRIWVHVRAPGGGPNVRSWRRSVFLDEEARSISVAFDEMKPFGPTTAGAPTPGEIRDVLFVVDTVHTRPGVNGQFWLDDVAVAR